MGSQVQCVTRVAGRMSKGKALLESDALVFRGDFHLVLAFNSLSAVEAQNGELRLTSPEGLVIFELGALAEKWAAKIRNTKNLLDKLGIKPDSQVALVGLRDESFRRQLRERT